MPHINEQEYRRNLQRILRKASERNGFPRGSQDLNHNLRQSYSDQILLNNILIDSYNLELQRLEEELLKE